MSKNWFDIDKDIDEESAKSDSGEEEVIPPNLHN